MMHRFPARFHRLALSMPAAALLALVTFSSAPAQPPTLPTLDQILQQLEKNLRTYDAKVPSLFCNEHVVSKIEPSQLHGSTATESIFFVSNRARSKYAPVAIAATITTAAALSAQGLRDRAGPPAGIALESRAPESPASGA